MSCHGSKYLLVSVLTFLLSLGTVQFWPGSNQSKNSVVFKQDIVNNIVTTSGANIQGQHLCVDSDYQLSRKGTRKVPGSDRHDYAVCLEAAVYLPGEIAVGAFGEVKVKILVDENGDVVVAKAISGHPL